MLVPAMTFAWWLVSMSSPTPHMAAANDSSAEAASERQQQDQDTEDEASPAEPANPEDQADRRNETTGRRVTLKVVTTEMVRLAKTFLDLPMGSERPVTIDGRRYVFVLEHHYHPPGFVGGPHGWHKGVTVYGLQ
jgi:hypothetical protein